ncbi:TfuA-like protein [Streptomyces sp. NPDC002659]|uniref:TfuA-like protein n=1 Tax=Streptomyces sp. NPDC002659 TaxID=3364656 RepID=UPI0036858E3D
MIHVYAGPTLGRSEPLLSAPSVRVLPPVRHGDFFDQAIADDDTVLIIDGVYHQAPALRYKEILAVMSRGVRVIGAASIGALRAAELYQFGMLGVGRVFQAYVRGDIDGDDEVAVGQEPGGEQRALTWPLVNLRYVLQLAQEDGVVSGRVAGGAAGLSTTRSARRLRCWRSADVTGPDRSLPGSNSSAVVIGTSATSNASTRSMRSTWR